MATYLPAGAEWYDFQTNERFAGGQAVKKNCPLDTLPVYVRAGSIVPMGPAVHYVNERPDAPYEIRLYPGADAKFTIYEDDGETYDYEKGQRATCDLVRHDAPKTLTVGACQGSFPGMILDRKLRIVLVAPNDNAASETVPLPTKTVTCSRRPVDVEFPF